MDSLRKDLPRAVHTALRRWHAGQQDDLPWAEMLTIAAHLAESPVPSLDLAVKELLLEALTVLEQQAGGDGVQILRLRFLDAHTAAGTANRLNLSTDVVYKNQRAAITDLAQIIWQAEVEVRSTRQTHIAGRLDVKDPPPLFGVSDKLAELRTALTRSDGPWMVAVVGIGGIGKTSLADAAVRALAVNPALADIAWVSARQERFTLWDGVQRSQSPPALTLEGLLDAIVEQFGFQDLTRLPLPQKRGGMGARLGAQPYLVVIDNLETAADYRALIPELRDLVDPTRFLFTSRHSLHEYPGVHGLTLDELSADDSLALLRHEASQRGLADLSAAPDDKLLRVHEAAGGNPLALKLLVGQMHTLSVPQVVDNLHQARGRRVEELYRYIYWRSWQLLSDEARRLLTIMPLVAESGGGLEQIAALSELAEAEMMEALQQLVALCLVNVMGTVDERRYGIHRLTETFLLNEVLKWEIAS